MSKLSVIGTCASLLGVVANVMSDYVSEKKNTEKMEKLVAEKVAEELAKLNNA